MLHDDMDGKKISMGDGSMANGPMKKMSISSGKMARMMDEMKYMRDEDMEPMDMEVNVDAEDGEEVGMVMMGTAKGGVMMNPMGTMIDLGEPEEKPGRLKKMLSEEDANEEE